MLSLKGWHVITPPLAVSKIKIDKKLGKTSLPTTYSASQFTMIYRFLALVFLTVFPAFAQDGGQLYTVYCSACHGADGKGATGGAFPPLAGSPWVTGDPDRSVKIVLHGLHGPIDVLGKTFNLEMPPQGGVLPDDQIAAILTHVRSSWGNQAAAVTTDQVKTIRAANTDRKTAWTSEEILKLHPLPIEKTALKNLLSRVYIGEWKELPDFSTIKPKNVEEEHKGILSPDLWWEIKSYAAVWEADFQAPASGEYTFFIDAEDSARLIINGKTLDTVAVGEPMDGSRAKEPKITLTQGSHRIRIEYLKISGEAGIALGWKGPNIKEWQWVSGKKGGPQFPSIPIVPTANKTAIYRNFITGSSPRAIGFGFPGGVNMSYSADNFTPEIIWTGKFMDGGRHWTERGGGNQAPAGESVIKLSSKKALPDGAKFKGYTLDQVGNPTFNAQIGDTTLADSWQPAAGGNQALVRKLTVAGKGQPLKIVVSDLHAGESTAPQELSLAGKVWIETTGPQPISENGQTSLTIAPGESATLTYRWKK